MCGFTWRELPYVYAALVSQDFLNKGIYRSLAYRRPYIFLYLELELFRRLTTPTDTNLAEPNQLANNGFQCVGGGDHSQICQNQRCWCGGWREVMKNA